jgi:glucokinase
MTELSVGIDIGGTLTKFVVLDARGDVVHRARIGTDDSAASRLPDDVSEEVTRIEAQLGPIAAIGVACPGLVRPEADAVYWMKGRLGVLEGLDWRRALGRAEPVRVINDAQAALAGECAAGAARGCRDVVMITIGTGVGGAIMCGGRVLTGSIGRAGHLGHISVQAPGVKDIVNTPGSLEDAIGNCTIARRTQGRFASTADLVAAHLAGDAEATAMWITSVQLLAAGLASIVNVVDPSRVILGGGIATHAGEALLGPLRHWMDEYEWRPRGTGVEIVVATLGDEAGAIGAAAHAREHSA